MLVPVKPKRPTSLTKTNKTKPEVEPNFPQFSKMDLKGNYTMFPGFTIVSPVDLTDQRWQLLHTFLSQNEILKKGFSLLPYESYHMTLIMLETATNVHRQKIETYPQFLERKLKFYHSLRVTLKETKFNLRFKPYDWVANRIILLEVALEKEQADLIQKIADANGLQSFLPGRFHITLAYQFEFLDSQQLELVADHMSQIGELFFDGFTKFLPLGPPSVCYFHDMTKFIPWETDCSPFDDSVLLGVQK